MQLSFQIFIHGSFQTRNLIHLFNLYLKIFFISICELIKCSAVYIGNWGIYSTLATINFFWFSRALFGLSMGKEYESVDIRGLESVEMVCRRAEPEEATERKLEAVQILHCKYEEVRVMYSIYLFFFLEGKGGSGLCDLLR